MAMFEEIKSDLIERMRMYTDSRQPTADEVRLAWLVSEVDRLLALSFGSKPVSVPEVVSKDRSDIHEIIEWMLENPDEFGIFPTTETFNRFEELLDTVRIEALGWTWAKACVLLDKGVDPRQHPKGQLIQQIKEDLNPPWVKK